MTYETITTESVDGLTQEHIIIDNFFETDVTFFVSYLDKQTELETQYTNVYKSLEFLSQRKLCILLYTFAYICQECFWLGFCILYFFSASKNFYQRETDKNKTRL